MSKQRTTKIDGFDIRATLTDNDKKLAIIVEKDGKKWQAFQTETLFRNHYEGFVFQNE